MQKQRTIKYIYIPPDTTAFKEYKVLSSFLNTIGKRIKPLTYVEFQMMRRYYSFDEIIDFITELCINGNLREYESLYMALDMLNPTKEFFYEGNHKGYNSKQSKFVHQRKGKRKALHRKKQPNEAIRTVFYKPMRKV